MPVLSERRNVNSRSRSLSSHVRLSVLCNVRTLCRQLKFSAMFLHHLVRWLSVDIQVTFYGDRPRETHPSGELKTRGVAEYSDFGAVTYLTLCIFRKRCNIRAKLVLINNRMLHMSFRLVPNSVTLDDLERRNSPNVRLISPNLVAFGADYVKVVHDTNTFRSGNVGQRI